MTTVTVIDEMKPLMAELEQRLSASVSSSFQEVNEICGHIISGGGKRLRPLLLLTLGRIIGYTESHMHLACAVELLHNASLLHDDVIDKSELRRGRPTANAAYGVPASILFGDYMYTLAFRLLLNYGNSEISRTLVDVVQIMSEGEIRQMFRSCTGDITVEEYFEIIGAKTSCLYSLSCELAALVSCGRDDPAAATCRNFGTHFGNAFQITDDMMDYVSEAGIMGKSPGDDFAEGKRTLPLIHLLGCCSEEEGARIRALLSLEGEDSGQRRRDAFPEVAELMRRHGSIDYCGEVAGAEADAAVAALAIFPDSPLRQFLADLAHSLVTRKV